MASAKLLLMATGSGGPGGHEASSWACSFGTPEAYPVVGRGHVIGSLVFGPSVPLPFFFTFRLTSFRSPFASRR